MHIGIVTEDEQSGCAIQKTLTYEQHDVHWYSNAQEAMASVLNAQSNGQTSHDIILVDLCLPGSIDGAEWIKRVREMLPNTATRFILIASTFDTGYDALIKKHLFDVHLMRKHHTESLLRQIEAFAQPQPVVIVEANPPPTRATTKAVIPTISHKKKAHK